MTTEIISRLNTALEGRYAVERELGAGGMATVYLARDVRHDRQVALKVLRPELAAILGAERFLQEIKTTANLQHPHILPLHDSGEAGGSVFYVMPYVEGESLRDRLEREKHLPIDDAVRIAREIASALDYAHRHGIVHRDIKPENILLHDGQALVADFGIALAVSRSDGGTRMTETGMSLGTPHYMSPEQAMGQREITPRSDVYALGCITYEMLSGDPPFTGSTAQAIVARVVTEQPRQLTLQRHTVPLHVEAAVFKALEKLPADRFATAAEFAEALINPAATASQTAAMPAIGMDLRWRRVALGAGSLALVAAAVALWGWLRPAPEPPVTRYSLGLPADQGMQQDVLGVNLAISPDGRHVVYLGPGDRGGRLWIRDRSRLEATPLAGTEGGVNPAFSPDGKQIAFSAGQTFTLKVVAIDGGPPVTLAEAGAGSGGGVDWSADGWIYYDTPRGFSRIRANGGEPELVVPLDSAREELGLAWPDALPGNRLLLRSRRNLNLEEFELFVIDLETGTRHTLTKGLLGRYIAPGFLVFVRSDGALVAARFLPGDEALRGSATPLLEGIMTKPFGSADLAISPEGTMMYVPGSGSSVAGEVVWTSRDGATTPLQPALAVSPSSNRGLALSPDGTRLAIDAVGPRSTDIWVKQLPSGPFSRLTFDGNDNIRPSWSADGRSILFLSNRDGRPSVWRQRADGSAPAELVLRRPEPIMEAVLSRNGRWLVYRITNESRDIFGIRLGQDTTPVPLLTSRFNEYAAALSPDGAWLAYISDESGTPEVYVRPFPQVSEGRWQISTGGGGPPRWSHSGRELLFEGGTGDMLSATVTTRPTFTAREPQRLFALGTGVWPSTIVPYFDLSPDDRRFMMTRIGGVAQAPGGGQLVVVEHWFQELRARVDAGQR
jgi:serine/threonine-protein kinase